MIHIMATFYMGRYAISEEGESVQTTNDAYRGMVIVTLYELVMSLFFIMGTKHLMSVIGGS